MGTNITTLNTSMFAPESYDHWCKIAKMMATSQMVPKGYQGKPQDILIAMELGSSLGMTPLAAIQNIAVINGKPSLYGDAMLAIIQGNKAYEYIKETIEINASGDKQAVCIIKRKGHDEHRSVFSVADAKKAGLLGKAGPWASYEDRMLTMRARGFAIRNTFADSLFGVSLAEEVQDYSEIKEVPVKVTASSRKEELLQAIKQNQESIQEPIVINPNDIDPETGEIIQ